MLHDPPVMSMKYPRVVSIKEEKDGVQETLVSVNFPPPILQSYQYS